MRNAAIVSKGRSLLEKLAEMITSEFGPSKLLAVRSSSSQEDLPNQAGAGLYDSYLDVPSDDKEPLIIAIVNVWCSLFTKRAVMSRRQLQT